MLFNSPTFLFIFLPAVLVLLAFLHLVRLSGITRAALLAASLMFYGWSNPQSLPLLLGSIAGNFAAGIGLLRFPRNAKAILALAVLGNIGLLVYFKYSRFLANDMLGLGISNLPTVMNLPVGISFFTFQQVAWVFDVARRRATPGPIVDYTLFISFFPQLIAGPIVHHCELLPQIQSPRFGRPRARLK